MINPTPIDQMPRFQARYKAANEQGKNKWLPIVIAAALVAVALIIASNQNRNKVSVKINPKIKNDNNERG